jgi:hypothetical protein
MIFGPSRESALARQLVDTLARELPPKLMTANRGVVSVNKVTRQLEKTYKVAADYQREYSIGFIRRALLANGFRWEMKNRGYPDDFVDVATEGLVVELSKARKAASGAGQG